MAELRRLRRNKKNDNWRFLILLIFDCHFYLRSSQQGAPNWKYFHIFYRDNGQVSVNDKVVVNRFTHKFIYNLLSDLIHSNPWQNV